MGTKALLKNIWLLSLPVILTNLLQTSITIIDMLMIGRLGPIAIAAAGMGNTIRLVVLISILSVSGGAMSLMAQAKGSRDPHKMSFVTRQSLVAGVMLSILIAIIGIIVTTPLLNFMDSGNDPQVVELGSWYLYVTFLATPFIILNFTTNRLMQGAGDMKTPLILTIILVILNIAFNYIFIFGYGPIPAYGIVGAAMGMMIARAIIAVIGIIIFYSGKNKVKILEGTYRPHYQMIKDILSIGVPSGIQGIFRHGSFIIVMSILTATSLGTLGAAALSICFQIESFATTLVLGLNITATAMIGQELGKWQPYEAYRKGTLLMYISFIAMAILITPLMIWSEDLILLFDPSANDTILEGGISYLHTNTLFLPITAISMLLTGALRGAGDTKPPMISTILFRNLTTVVFAYIFVFHFDMSYMGVWYAIIIGRITDAIYMWFVWKAQNWKLVALKKTDIYRTHLKDLSKETIIKFLKQFRTPQMMKSKTVEVITLKGVTYTRPRSNVEVEFKNGTFSEVKSTET